MIKKSELGKLKMPAPEKKKAVAPEVEAGEFDVEAEAEAEDELLDYEPEAVAEAEEDPLAEELVDETAVSDGLAEMSDEDLEAELARRRKTKSL